MNWMYNGNEYLERHSDDVYGFVYRIFLEDNDGKVFTYYGKKNFNSVVKKNFGKKKLAAITDKRVKKYEMITKESNWKEYIGSSKETQKYIPIRKEILMFAKSGRHLTYLEAKTLFVESAIEDPMCLNISILKRFFRDNLV